MGSDLKTELVLLSYLQCGKCDDGEFTSELSSLSNQLKTECPPVPRPVPMFMCSFDGDLQTDGNTFSRSGNFVNHEVEETEPDICVRIGRLLAGMGDQLDNQVHQEVIDGFIQNLLDDRLSTEERSQRLSRMIDSLAASIPPGLELEKTKLLLAMVLAKKVASSVPGLLQRVFWTTVGFINQNLRTSIDSLIRPGNV